MADRTQFQSLNDRLFELDGDLERIDRGGPGWALSRRQALRRALESYGQQCRVQGYADAMADYRDARMTEQEAAEAAEKETPDDDD